MDNSRWGMSTVSSWAYKLKSVEDN